MKVNLQRAQEEVLLYHLEESTEKGQLVRRVFAKMRVPVRTITDEMLGETLGYAAGLVGFGPSGEAYTGPGVESEVLIMNSFTEKRMNEMFRLFREHQVPPIPLKAVITENNKKWRLIDLFSELDQERVMIAGYRKLQDMIGQAAKRKAEDADPEAWSRLEAAVERAGQLLTGKAEPSLAYLEETIAQLTDALAAVPAAE